MRKMATLAALGLVLTACAGAAAEPLKMQPGPGEWAIHAIRSTVNPDDAERPARADCVLNLHTDNPGSWLFPFEEHPSPANVFVINTVSHARVTYLDQPLSPGIAKARRLEGILESATWDIKKLGHDVYVAVETESASRFGKRTRLQRVTLTARRLGPWSPDGDVTGATLLDPEINSLWRC